MNRQEPADILQARLNVKCLEVDSLRAQAAAQGEDLQAARAIGESFFEALKPLNLQAINVANPGQHVTDLIALVARLGEQLSRFVGIAAAIHAMGPSATFHDLLHLAAEIDSAKAMLAELAPTTTTP